MLSFKHFGFVLFFLVLLVAACSYGNEWTTAQATTYDGKRSFTLRFPPFLKPETQRKLHHAAPIQYANYFRNVYAIAYDTLAPDYRSVAQTEITNLLAIAQKPQLIDTATLSIDGKPAYMGIYTGNVGRGDIEERIYYQLVFVQGTDRVYVLVQWVWDKNREKYREILKQVVTSFKEG